MRISPEQWERVKALYEAALECNPEQRFDYLQQNTVEEVVRKEVRRLLAEQDTSGRFLSTPPFVSLNIADAQPENRFVANEILADRFRIKQFIAAGGMGEVYEAEDLVLRESLAVKTIRSEVLQQNNALQRFKREVQLARKVTHPNICRVFDLFWHKKVEHEKDEIIFFVSMELLKGETLSKRLRCSGRFSAEEALPLINQIASGVDAAHRVGVVHRDLKPGNVILVSDTDHNQIRCVITDFGLALSTGVDTEKGTDLTGSRAVFGTPAYMAPEQIEGKEVTKQADIYAFGLVIYEMVTGEHAYPADTPLASAARRLSDPLVSPRKYAPELNDSWEQTIIRCLQRDPKARFDSALEVASSISERTVEPASAASASQSIIEKKATASWWKVAAPIMAVIIILAAAVLYRQSRSSTRLTDKDTIVLADFANTTGDSVFDGALREGLSVQLEQSPFLRIVSGQQVQQTLSMMNQKPNAQLTPELARELCQRINGTAVFNGSIAQIGSKYLLTVKAVNCSTGESIASTEAQAEDKDHVADALGRTASQMRSKLGESLATVQRFDTPLEQQTTASLEALKAHSIGRALREKGDCAGAISFYQQAITFDPNYALGYLSLGACYANEGESSLATDNMRHAFELRANVSEQEKLWIESYYYLHVDGDLEKTEQKLRVWRELYPREDKVPNALGIIYDRLGDFGKAQAEYRHALELNPNSGTFRNNLVIAMIRLNHFDEAQALLDEGRAKNVDPYVFPYILAFLRNDRDNIEQQTALFEKLGRGDWLLPFRPDTAAYFGQLKNARTLSNLAVAEAKREHEKESWAQYEVYAALREALFGNKAESRKYVNSVLQSSNGRSVQYGAALALTIIGDTDRATSLADDLHKRFPNDTVVQRNCVPTLRAQVAVNLKHPAKAIEILQDADPYELSEVVSPLSRMALYPAYVRGMAYLASHRGEEAGAEFQKILDHRGLVWNSPLGAVAHLQIGRAYAIQGDASRARGAYQDFLALWQDADPDIPILKAAKAEYARIALTQQAIH